MSSSVASVAIETDSGMRKAAMLLILLGEQTGGELVKQLSEDEVHVMGREVARIESITSEQAEALLEEFYQMTIAHEFVLRGGLDFAKKMLMTAFGPEASKKLIDRWNKRLARTSPAGTCYRKPILSSLLSSSTTSTPRRLRWFFRT